MLSPEIKKKIKEIEIYTRRLISGSFVGDTTSAIKGSGMAFDQIREYQLGDDVRFIDWNSSARMNKLLVKQYFEERNRTIFLLVDVSGSEFFSSGKGSKMDALAQLASALTLVAEYGKDRIGLVLFSDVVECYIPPSHGRAHTHRIMEKLFATRPQHKATNINCALDHVAQLKERNAMVFLLSDCIDTHPVDKTVGALAQRHDFVVIRALDGNENELPAVGFLPVQDIETGEQYMLDVRRPQAQLNSFLKSRVQEQDSLFKRYGIDVLTIDPSQPFISDVILFFRRRMMY